MLTSLTSDLGFWIIFSTALIGVGTYKLLTKQNADANEKNSEQIKKLGEKIDGFSTDIKMEQVRFQSNFEHMNEKINKMGDDMAATRAQSNVFAETISAMQVKLQNIGSRGDRHDFN